MADDKKTVEKKGFFARLMDSLDKKMEDKAKSGGCCCCGPKSNDSENKKCC
jgi:hypothetical protein